MHDTQKAVGSSPTRNTRRDNILDSLALLATEDAKGDVRSYRNVRSDLARSFIATNNEGESKLSLKFYRASAMGKVRTIKQEDRLNVREGRVAKEALRRMSYPKSVDLLPRLH